MGKDFRVSTDRGVERHSLSNQYMEVVLSDRGLCGHDIVIGESVATVIHSAALTTDQLKVLHHLYLHHCFILIPLIKQKKIYIMLQEGVSANSNEIVEAYFYAILLGIAINMIDNVSGKVNIKFLCNCL